MKPLQFLNIWTLREYLEQDFSIPESSDKMDIERIVDDFVFMTFFVGNDFLPQLPSLQIHENAIDLLIHVYKEEFKNMGGYLIDTTRLMEKKAAFVETKRVEMFIQAVAGYETEIFIKRYNLIQAKLKSVTRQRMEENDYEACNKELSISADEEHSVTRSDLEAIKSTSSMLEKCVIRNRTAEEERIVIVLRNTKELILSLDKILQDRQDLVKHESPGNDKIMLGHRGSKERYYRNKFLLTTSSEIHIQKEEVVQKYTECLCWTLIYYYMGVPSWQWFYPFHYAPFASDLKDMPWSSVCFDIGAPIKPFEHLLFVLPPRSAHALPKAYGRLMTMTESPLSKFYPDDFEVDIHGKRFRRQGIIKLPFIDEDLLVAEAQKLEKELENEEIARNSFQNDRIYMLKSHNFASQISSTLSGESRVKFCADGMNGYLCSSMDVVGGVVTQKRDFPSSVVGMEDIQGDDTVCAEFMNPDAHYHVPRLPQGIEIPEKTITARDIEWRPLWHEHHGNNPRTRFVPADRRAVAGTAGRATWGSAYGRRGLGGAGQRRQQQRRTGGW